MTANGFPDFDERPDWTPLENLLPNETCADFMHMGRIGTMQMYKHRLTRRYLNIDAISGTFFVFRHGEYHAISRVEALKSVFQ